MINDGKSNPGSRALSPLRWVARHGASAALTPLSGAAAVALRIAVGLERHTVEPVLGSPEVTRLLSTAVEDLHVKAAVTRILESDGARQLIDGFFDSGLFDDFVERLLASEALWRLVDEVAASPAVTAAITDQGLGFVDQVGEEVRSRSRGADDWLEWRVRRLMRRRATGPAPDSVGR